MSAPGIEPQNGGRDDENFLTTIKGFIYPELTNVELPPVLHLRKRTEITEFMRQLVIDEAVRDPSYYGVIIGGSVAYGTADDGSDIDLAHVNESGRADDLRGVMYRFNKIFQDLYGVRRLDQYYFTFGLDKLRKNPEDKFQHVRHVGRYLNKHSVIIIPDISIYVEIVSCFDAFLLNEPHPDDPRKAGRTHSGLGIFSIRQDLLGSLILDNKFSIPV